MYRAIVAIVISSTIFLTGCGSNSQSVEDRVNARIAAMSQQEKEDMCKSYELFGADTIRIFVDGIGSQNGVSKEEADMVFTKIVELCSNR